ncbi:MAG: DUF6273 domain-containing protein [Synergistes sp.]|nr:DUF6273 domain-containing protein [Synergistes sp.]
MSGYTKSGIKWRVLANNTTADDYGNKGILLLADQALFADTFNVTGGGNQWRKGDNTDSSKIRKDLTSVTDGSESSAVAVPKKTVINADGTIEWGSFAGDAFNAKEYAAIADTTHDAGGETSSGHDISTTDKLFLLSYEEAKNTAYGFSDNLKRRATPTDLARNVKMYDNTGVACVETSGAAWWWLRSPGNAGSAARYVDSYGNVGVGTSVGHFDGPVRAALNLD